MIKKKIILLFAIVFVSITNAQSISFTSATLTKGLIGNTIQVDYEYTIGASGYIYCAIENQQQNWTSISTVASADLNPAPAGTSVAGSFSLVIPTSTIPFYNLPNGSDGVQTVYRIKITLSDSSFNYLNAQFPGDWIQLTNFANFTGTTDSNWSTTSNWDVDVPNATTNVTIPASQNAVISSTTGANTNNLTVNGAGSLTLNAGGSLKVTGTSTGNITYIVNVSDTNWHLVSSPVNGEQYDDTWITNNDIASGSDFTTNRGISWYDNTSLTSPNIAGEGGHWRYFQGGATAQNFGTGVGYALIKDTNPGVSSGNFSFTGTMPSSVSPAINQGVNNWNLIGNSYPSYMDVAAFITENGTSGTDKLADANQAIYIFNASTSAYEALTTGYIQPGQAFFVNSKLASTTVAITKAMQSHQTGVTFYKTNLPSINLSVSNNATTKSTAIHFYDEATKSLDPGLDIGLFDGVSSDLRIYSHLVDDNQGISFGKQALPLSEMESVAIPIGLEAKANQELTFSLSALNLSSDTKVYLEDKVKNTFTLFTNNEVKITLNEAANGIGRFYIVTSSNALQTENIILQHVAVYPTNDTNLRVVGLPSGKASLKLFNTLGKAVFTASFSADIKMNDIRLPQLSKGVYLVQIQTKEGNLNKKIILK
ncbi:Por secretion system C-terminal sorting domain-containing protein [Polaribacter sp. Hel1_33_78]|nr:Por secretion system C-terminal sorting domain-containing protein [Polaribacter sp. Hel1_33_78]